MATTTEQIRAVQITLWLGANQEVSIKLGKTLAKRLDVPEDIDFQRSGFAINATQSDLLELVPEILEKLQKAFPNKEPITLSIDEFNEPVPSPKPV